ncbi:hypothetical protein CJD92_22370 [Salmonella enterica subsp. enterica serovar Newport]|nr:hypothetical protein [Salmonella enterica subsp. enterica serovar Newport]
MALSFDVPKFTDSVIALFKQGYITDNNKFSVVFAGVKDFFVGKSYNVAINKVVKEAGNNSKLDVTEMLPFQSALILAIDTYFKADIQYTTEFNPKNHIEHKFMATKEFISIADYPANRDVTQRMKKEHMKTLNNYEQTKVVIVAITEKNEMYWKKVESEPVKGVKLMKLDGHSRAYAWTHKQLEVPEMLSVTVYKNLTDEQINRCYDALTSPLTAATVTEQAYTLKKRTDFEPVTKFVGSNWKTAFVVNDMAFNETNYIKFVPHFKTLENWLVTDFENHGGKECKQPKGMNSAGIKAAIIEQCKRDGDISQFWCDCLTGKIEERSKNLTISKLFDAAETSGNGAAAVLKLSDVALKLCDEWEQSQNAE